MRAETIGLDILRTKIRNKMRHALLKFMILAYLGGAVTVPPICALPINAQHLQSLKPQILRDETTALPNTDLDCKSSFFGLTTS